MVVGYPDFGTRCFLRKLSKVGFGSSSIPILVLTDADPHGLAIAYCYMQELRECRIQWLGARHSDVGSLFQVDISHMLRISARENVLLDGMLKRWSEEGESDVANLHVLVSEAKRMKSSQLKFEMEALSFDICKPGISKLLEYVSSRLHSLLEKYLQGDIRVSISKCGDFR